MLLALVSAVSRGSESLGTRDPVLHFQISSPPSTRSVTVELSNPPPHGLLKTVKVEVTLRLTVSMSWCRAPSGAHDQIFITVWQLRSADQSRSLLPAIPPAQSLLASGPAGTHDHILVQCLDVFSFLLRWSSLMIKRRSCSFFWTGVHFLTLFPLRLHYSHRVNMCYSYIYLQYIFLLHSSQV
jgi:hypothetical protein